MTRTDGGGLPSIDLRGFAAGKKMELNASVAPVTVPLIGLVNLWAMEWMHPHNLCMEVHLID